MTSKKNLLLLIFISFLIFGSKWIVSYYLFTETTSIKIIFESVADGYYYFPLVKYLAIFEFNNSFNPYFEKLDNVMLPFYSIFIPSLFYKFIVTLKCENRRNHNNLLCNWWISYFKKSTL